MLNLFELAEVIQESLEIEVVRYNRFRIFFKSCEIKDSKCSSIVKTEWGIGDTINEAADDYFRKINKKWLVFDGMRDIRREYSAYIYQAA